jgi:hypothetical protein
MWIERVMMRKSALACWAALYLAWTPPVLAENAAPQFHSLGDLIVRLDDIAKIGLGPGEVTLISSIVRPEAGGSRGRFGNVTVGKSTNPEDIRFFTDLVTGHWPQEVTDPRSRAPGRTTTYINPRRVSLASLGRAGRGSTRPVSLYEEHGLWLGNSSIDHLGDQLQDLAAELTKTEGAPSGPAPDASGPATGTPR